MEKISSVRAEQLIALLAQRVDDRRADLVSRYFDVLRESLFSNRAEVRPSTLKSVAADEVEALLHFFRQPDFSAKERGKQLHRAGFNAGAVLRLGQVTRQFLLNHSDNGQIAPLLEIVDAYETGVVEGFIQSIGDTNKAERVQLERVLIALYQRGDK